MEAKASVRNVRISPRKVGIVLDLIRGKDVETAAALLDTTPKSACEYLGKLLKSAVSNAVNNFDMDSDSLYISECYVGPGPILKRIRPRAQGRAFRINKRTSNITLVVKERN
ncbi:MAG: 50S ribosomal protein L22 [Oscillospiraceae bacterium]|nr:50S ribosomal protein L22 [Oscillospiraceae bacterium]